MGIEGVVICTAMFRHVLFVYRHVLFLYLICHCALLTDYRNTLDNNMVGAGERVVHVC